MIDQSEERVLDKGFGLGVSEISEQEPLFSEEDIRNAFTDLLKDARDEDRQVRDEQLRQWRRLEYYWNNILDIFMDPVSRDWRVPDWTALEEEGEVSPRLINIYRPHGEAIVAALSITVPSIIFHPDDADNPDDVEAAKAYRNITDLLALHNEAPMLFIRAITILFNQGTIFGYNYYHQDPKFGTLNKPKVEFKDIDIFEARCPECGEPLDAGVNPQQQYQCPECNYTGPAEITNSVESLPQIVGFDKSPKGSICQELFSGLNVKISSYAKKQEECGYLLLEFAQSVAMLRSIFYNPNNPELLNKINAGVSQDWEGFSKLPMHYLDDMPNNAANVSCLWLRPWQFWQLGVGRIELINYLVKTYPDGCYALFINNELMDHVPENMDEHWTISKNPLGSFIHMRPMGENLSTIQDIRAELVEIELQTAEHGIPETFVEADVIDFKKYGEGRNKPGMITQVRKRPGKNIQDSFFTTKTAILSQEIDPLRQHIDQDAQFVVGSFPSVYGGPATGGSKTASEYSQSRTIALQRLGTIWKIASQFWSQFQSRSAVEYAKVVRDLGQDERFTKREGKNNFVNVWIRSTSLSGTIGRVEPESSEQLPSSWAQKKDTILQLLTTSIPEILQVLAHPSNAEIMKEAVGLADLYIPGEEDRMRQFKEFAIMSQGIPIPTNPLVDNESIHIEILKNILEGQLGDSLDQNARMIVEQHLMMHVQSVQQQQEKQAEQELKMQEKGKAQKTEKSQVSGS